MDTNIETSPKRKVETGTNLQKCNTPLSPARELLVWEKWIQIRKEETAKLGKKLNRAPVDLAMNLAEKVREDIERKTVLEHAQVEKKLVTFRGTLFEAPPKLKQNSYCEPLYEVQRTKAELGNPQVIEHVGVPKYIQKTELGMSGEPQRKACYQLDVGYKDYRRKRETELIENLKKIDPFKPSTSQLLVQGYKPKTPPPKIPPLPTMYVVPPTTDHRVSISGVYAVKINNSVFYKEVPSQNLSHLVKFENQKFEDCTTWTYYFNVPVRRMGRGKLNLQNLGTVTLRYCWKKIKRLLQFIPTDLYEQVFFFNKNEDVLSPGQCKDIFFTFVSDKPGIYSEYWELCFLNVCFFDTMNERFNIDLSADSVENAESMKQKCETLKNLISGQAIYSFATKLVNDVFDKIFEIVPQTYPYKKYFLEGELFVMKNPVCFYHQTEVAKLTEMYQKEMTNGQTWDLSIASWRKTMMTKKYEERMKYFDALKKCHSECLKPWYEGDELSKDKYRAMNNLWGQLADKLDAEYERIRSLYEQNSDSEHLSKPVLYSNTNLESLIDPLAQQKIRNLFFLHAYDHVATTIELCAGILSSLDSNRWIHFEFCRH